LIGGYELRGVLREEGAATVFAAHHLGLRRDVELRVLRPEAVADDPSARERFRAAAVAIAALEHPGMTPIYAFGELDDSAWIASRRLDGPSLADELAAGAVTPRRTLAAVEELADVLAALHARGLVHRDVRPDAVWPLGRRVLLGLPGIARSDGATRLEGAMLGDAQYLALEQLRGDAAEPPSDVFSLGAVALACLCGGHPFGELDVGDLLRRRARPEPPAATLRGAGCRPLNDWLASVMAADPARRPGAADAARGLGAVLRELPDATLDLPSPFRAADAAGPAPTRVMPLRARPAAAEALPAIDRSLTRPDRQRPAIELPPVPAAERSRGPLVALIAAAVLLPLGSGVVGRLTAPAAPPADVRSGAATFPLGNRWTPAPPGTHWPLTDVAGGRVLRSGDAIAEVGTLRRPGPRTDPLGQPGAHPIRLSRRPALAYDLGGMRVLVVQSDRTAAVVACRGLPAPSGCDALAAAARLPGRVVAPAPDPLVARALGTTLLSLHNLVVSRQLAVRDRHDLADVQELYKRALSDLSTNTVGGPDRAILAAVEARLRAVITAYDPVVAAHPSAAERAVARRAVERLRAAVSALRRQGYPTVSA
jgi:serine/threonine-protein kinase